MFIIKPITFKDMMVNKIHLGTYIKCNSIARPFYVSGMHLLVQDTKGDYEHLVLHNFNPKSCDVDPQVLIPLVIYFSFFLLQFLLINNKICVKRAHSSSLKNRIYKCSV